jgi:SAM-dependent methyltransferase
VEALGKVAPWIARRAEAEGDTFVRAGHFFAGFTDLQHVDQVVRAHTGRSLTEMEDVLDWGCGCGRVTQHLARAGVVRPAGADIDPENIAWCIDHIPDARFERLALDPPTPYPDDSFDAVFGLSVFTHLTEADQFRWLEELRRILKPGGVLAVTVAGHNALKRAALGAAIRFHRSTRERGFADDNIGNLFGDLLQDRRAYYRNTRHLPDYVRERWSPYFEILGIELGAMAGQQDVVIGRKRG